MSHVAIGIKTLIKEKGLLQQYIAEKAGFTKQQFSYMLNDRQLILADYLPQIAAALNVSIQDIYNKASEGENNAKM